MSENSKLGLQYFSDNLHYHQHEAEYWLNQLKELGVSWLALDSTNLIAIPEPFLAELLKLNITPIIRFNFPYSLQKPPHEFQLILTYYQKIGIHYMVFFDQPNSQGFWSEKEWLHGDIVERFIDLFLPYAKLAIANGIQPIFPPLVVADEYWDTAFIKLALQSLVRRCEKCVLDQLLISAYAHVFDLSRPLNWGAGGPQRFPEARPFSLPGHSQDQKGLHIDDWYSAIAKEVLGHPLPMVLFEGDQTVNLNQLAELSQLDERRLKIIKSLLHINSFPSPFANGNEIISFSDNTICFVFSQLVEQIFSDTNYLAWYDSYRNPKPFSLQVKAWMGSSRYGYTSLGSANGHHQLVLLIPPLPEAQLNAELAQIQPYLLQKQPKIVFSVDEALQAEHVALISHLNAFSTEELERLNKQPSEIEWL